MAIKKPAAPVKKAAAPVKKTNAPRSLADLFDETDASEASNLLPEGLHEVRLNAMILKEDKQGARVTATYEAITGDFEGKKSQQMYKLTDPSGTKGPGFGFLKRDLALLGYDGIEGVKLKKTLSLISEEQPIVTVKIKQNGNYTNCYLAGLADEGVTGEADGGEGEVEIEVGDEVTWDDDGTSRTGTVTKLKGDTAMIKDSDGEKYNVDISELSKGSEGGGESEAEAAEIEVGSVVSWEDDDGDAQTGTVLKIKGDQVTIKKEDDTKDIVDIGNLALMPAEEAEAEPASDPDVIEVGDEVIFNDDGDKGTVKSITGKKALVIGEDKKKYNVLVADIEKVAEEGRGDDVIEVGSEVAWRDADGDDHTGKVIKISEATGKATIEDESEELFKVDIDDLEKQ